MDPHPGEGASRAAVGMIAPASEVVYQQHALYPLMMESAALLGSGTDLTTVAMRRYSPDVGNSLVGLLECNNIRILPNTAGCYTARGALLTAELGREALETD